MCRFAGAAATVLSMALAHPGGVRRQPRAGEERRDPVQVVEDQLRRLPASPIDPEPEPVQYLRRYSRYMTPKVGLLSADTWTLVAIFLRNLFLNWLVLLPLIAA